MAARKNPAAVALGRRKSPAKAAAARINGAKGGRPVKPRACECQRWHEAYRYYLPAKHAPTGIPISEDGCAHFYDLAGAREAARERASQR